MRDEHVRAIQQFIFASVIGAIGVLAIIGTARHVFSSLLIAIVIAYAMIHNLLQHHRKGRHKSAARGFSRSLITLGVLLLISGVATLVFAGALIAVMDLITGTILVVHGVKHYSTLTQ